MEINQIIDEEEVVEAEKQPDQYVDSKNRKRVKPPTEKKKARKLKFMECVAQVSLESRKGLRGDVPTRWNSTYLMLEGALYYRLAFVHLQLSDCNYNHCPSEEEWKRVEQISSFLGLFYQATTTLLTPRGFHGSPSVQCKDVLFEDFDKCEEECSSTRLSELQLYFNEQKLDRKKGIDILSFWKGEQYRYPILSCLARDVLSIPISTVASESAFSIGGRVLDQYRSSLLPETVQAVICTRDWIYGKKIVDDCGADMGEATKDVFNNDTY